MRQPLYYRIYRKLATNRPKALALLSKSANYLRCLYVFPSPYGIEAGALAALYEAWALAGLERLDDKRKQALYKDIADLKKMKTDRLYEIVPLPPRSGTAPLIIAGYTVPQYWQSSFKRYK